MKLNDLRQLLDNNIKAQKAIKYIYLIPEYKSELNKIDSTATIQEVYTIIIKLYLSRLEIIDNLLTSKNDETRNVKKLSKALYNEQFYWTIGSKWEYLRNKEIERSKVLEQAKEKYEKMEYLASTLGLSKSIPKNKDIFKFISRDTEISDIVINNLDSIKTRETLYNLCTSILIKRFEGNYIKYNDYYMLMALSAITYHDRYYWAKSNALNIENITFQRPINEE